MLPWNPWSGFILGAHMGDRPLCTQMWGNPPHGSLRGKQIRKWEIVQLASNKYGTSSQ